MIFGHFITNRDLEWYRELQSSLDEAEIRALLGRTGELTKYLAIDNAVNGGKGVIERYQRMMVQEAESERRLGSERSLTDQVFWLD